jgi:hypothetical protein
MKISTFFIIISLSSLASVDLVKYGRHRRRNHFYNDESKSELTNWRHNYGTINTTTKTKKGSDFFEI